MHQNRGEPRMFDRDSFVGSRTTSTTWILRTETVFSSYNEDTSDAVKSFAYLRYLETRTFKCWVDSILRSDSRPKDEVPDCRWHDPNFLTGTARSTEVHQGLGATGFELCGDVLWMWECGLKGVAGARRYSTRDFLCPWRRCLQSSASPY